MGPRNGARGVMALALAGVASLGIGSGVAAASACPVTIPNASQPPPGGGSLGPGTFETHGNGQLWTILPQDGVWRVDPRSIEADGSFVEKFVWWRRVVEQTTSIVNGVLTASTTYAGELSITGRRQDGQDSALKIRTYPEGVHVGSTITFPAGGCWEITGMAGADSLTFTVYVLPPGEPVPDTALVPRSVLVPIGSLVVLVGIGLAVVRRERCDLAERGRYLK
ncbi:MAG TPA: hypothetical protein VEW95_11070 [Candidatus Limnocylindrales bacterium]|nr:hypothetical protein [Candidatus Limnocylindrales bacterium]